uniref:Adenylyl-sulfate kinase 3-like n=1 Tax=Rhizophora mucronata TaxID=61149 RepID=A0A2P2L0G3_RHIMU
MVYVRIGSIGWCPFYKRWPFQGSFNHKKHNHHPGRVQHFTYQNLSAEPHWNSPSFGMHSATHII